MEPGYTQSSGSTEAQASCTTGGATSGQIRNKIEKVVLKSGWKAFRYSGKTKPLSSPQKALATSECLTESRSQPSTETTSCSDEMRNFLSQISDLIKIQIEAALHVKTLL